MKTTLFAFALLILSTNAWALGAKPAPTAPTPTPTPAPPVVVEDPLPARYSVKNATQKIVDNRGNGYEALYGTRNMRMVLKGVYYRGGANNYYHRSNKRDNMNPLPNDGLENLCQEGFGRAVYFYDTNFNTAPSRTTCRNFENNSQQLNYEQATVLSGKTNERKVLGMIYDHIRDSRLGPIYGHCWNGWHASGYAAATALRQFCGFTGNQAVAYWDVNTDGANKGANYDRIREKIRAFQPYPELSISAAEKAAICPNGNTLEFPR